MQIRNVPPSAPSSKLRDVFASTGDVKGIWVRFQETHGIVILAFYDVRHAIRAKRQISNQVLRGLEDTHLEAMFISPENLETVRGHATIFPERATDQCLTFIICLWYCLFRRSR